MRNLTLKVLRFPAVFLGYIGICVGFVLAFVGAALAKAGAYISSLEPIWPDPGLNIVVPEDSDLTDEELAQFINEALEARSKQD